LGIKAINLIMCTKEDSDVFGTQGNRTYVLVSRILIVYQHTRIYSLERIAISKKKKVITQDILQKILKSCCLQIN